MLEKMTTLLEYRQQIQDALQGLLASKSPSFIEGLKFILSHFEEPIWPRTISTHTTEGRQVLVFNKEEALARFKQANLLDCRINAYSDYTGFNGINRQSPNFIFVGDIDHSRFKTDRSFKFALLSTIRNISKELGANPTILWTGNGYHIYQPVQAFLLEQESLFSQFDQPSQQFLKFAEKYLSGNKSDPYHNPAFKSCMVRIPGSHNFKCVQRNNGIADSKTEVKIIQQWNGFRPKINPMLCELYIYLAGQKLREMKRQRQQFSKYRYENNNKSSTSTIIPWIETLLQTPLSDHRKYVILWILPRYLANKKGLSYDEAFAIIKDWLAKCDKLERLDPTILRYRLKGNLDYAIKTGKFAIGLEKVKIENKELYDIIVSRVQ